MKGSVAGELAAFLLRIRATLSLTDCAFTLRRSTQFAQVIEFCFQYQTSFFIIEACSRQIHEAMGSGK